PEDGISVRKLLEESNINLVSGSEGQTVLLDGADVTEAIRTEEVSNQVSFVAKHKEVREEMVKRQRVLAERGGVVMDGRDVGTHILPKAEVKIFLSASVQIRAKRRYEENLKKGIASDLKQMEADIALRDRRDSERETAPLMKAEDAIEVDTTNFSIEEAAAAIMSIVKERAG
ncbi:MAG TPA: (d)CMP kinase, partial [Bacillales bacterium]|nr:(d)CMP kinase [Bacillales bacterium]